MKELKAKCPKCSKPMKMVESKRVFVRPDAADTEYTFRCIKHGYYSLTTAD